MNRPELIEHLRTAHGLAELEPGGIAHEPGAVGFPEPLDRWPTARLRVFHTEDHHGEHDHDHEEPAR